MADPFEQRAQERAQNQMDPFEVRAAERKAAEQPRGSFFQAQGPEQTVQERIERSGRPHANVPGALFETLLQPYEDIAQRINAFRPGTLPSTRELEERIQEKTGAKIAPKEGEELQRAALQLVAANPQELIKSGVKGGANLVKKIASKLKKPPLTPPPPPPSNIIPKRPPPPPPESRALVSKVKQPPPPPKQPEGLPPEKLPPIPSPEGKMRSGMTKLAAIEAKHPEKGIISPSRQQKAIEMLDKEAAELTKASLEKHLPIVKEIQAGHDFSKEFEKKFGILEKLAIKANPDIDVTPMTKFLNETVRRYRGIPEDLLHKQAKKILKEADTYRNFPQTAMKNLYRLFRINNKKLGEIYEQKLLKGAQREYSEFLEGLNRTISDAFASTLPEDSEWLKRFLNTNKRYSQYKKGQKALAQLESVLNAEANPGTIMRLAQDPRTQKKLEISMGKKGADEVIQIAKDLKLAKESIKRIPAKELKAWDAIFPLSALIPGMKIPGSVGLAKSGVKLVRRGYGYLLTTPDRRHSYENALRAIIDNDKDAYKNAASLLKDSLLKELPFNKTPD